jgi:2'-5' RNA ligase
VRLFLALAIPPEARAPLRLLQSQLPALGRGSLTRPENLHLTLAFLGEVPSSRAEDAAAALVRAGGGPFALSFGHPGLFHARDGDIVWAAPCPCPALSALQGRLCRELSAEGFFLEERPFSPHVTLARRMVWREGTAPELPPVPPFSFKATGASLFCSSPGPGGPVYTELFRARFGALPAAK